MSYTTAGSFIEEIRKAKKITRKQLSYGICSEHALREIEEGRNTADILVFDLLIQRLGQSPDQFEMILTRKDYDMVRFRDLIEEAVLRGKRELAEKLLNHYPSNTNTDKMYQYRMRAHLAYYIDKDCRHAAAYLEKAIFITLPDFTFDQIDGYMISTMEMENLLALERMIIEQNPQEDCVRKIAKSRLEAYMDYIMKHFTDEGECAKLCSKCAWLLGGVYYLEKNYMQTVIICEKGIEGLRKNTILYFIFPLLNLMTKAEAALGIMPARSKWVQYNKILAFLWEGYAKKWYPADSLFHNCYQRDYHLDYELVRSERETQKITQAELAWNVYRNAESYSRMETGKVSPNRNTFQKLMSKLGIKKGKYNGCVITESFEVMEIKRNIDGFVMRRDYQKARELTEVLKKSLDMEIAENHLVVSLYEAIIAKRFGEITAEDALERFIELSENFMDFDKKTFSHIPMRNEVLVINNICIALCEIGQKKEAVDLYRITLEKIKSSRIKVKYRYLSYAILLNNYVRGCGELKGALEELQNEFLCGKASEFSLCLNNILQILDKNGVPEDECDEWAIAVYYMNDLFYMQKDKEIYGTFLRERKNIEILD